MKCVKTATAILGALMAMTSAAAVELVRNGSFEDVENGKTVGWTTPAHYTIRDGIGRNGTRGIAFDNDDPSFYRYPSQQIAFENGKRYAFSVWAKTENLTGAKVCMCMEWYDASGKWIAGAYQVGFGGTHDWAKIEGKTPPIPDNAAKLSFQFFIGKKGVGKAWFDDASVTLLERKTFGGLYTDVYRAIAADGKALFHAAINLGERDPGTVTAGFSYQGADGRRHCVKADSLAKDCAKVELDVSRLAFGTHPVACRILDADGRKIGEGKLDFTRTEKPLDRPVWFDRHGRTIVNGRPFFPLGMYVNSVTTNHGQFATYIKGPFNCLMPYHEPSFADMDLCHTNGLKVIYPFNSVWKWHQYRPKGVETDADADAYVERKALEVKGHPSVLAWYCNDEISLEKFPQLLSRQRVLERVDPGHPTWTVLYQYPQVREYYPTFDVVGGDPYPVPDGPIDTPVIWTRTMQEETMGLKPLWQVPQAFSWADYGRKGERMPTRAEMRNMSWQMVAEGAMGLVYYHYRLLWPWSNEQKRVIFHRDRWEDICAAAEGVKRFADVILSVEPAPALKWTAKKICARSWRHEGRTYALVVNATHEAVDAALDIADPFKSVKVVYGEGTKAELKSPTRIKAMLEPLGVGMLELR